MEPSFQSDLAEPADGVSHICGHVTTIEAVLALGVQAIVTIQSQDNPLWEHGQLSPASRFPRRHHGTLPIVNQSSQLLSGRTSQALGGLTALSAR